MRHGPDTAVGGPRAWGARWLRAARRSVLPWWVVVGGCTMLLLAYVSPWTKLHFRSFYRFKARYFVLADEMNFGVWWSATLFLVAAALLYEVASRERPPLRRGLLQLALLFAAFSLDEIGSLHEWLSGLGGWTALAPFGLIAFLLVGDSLRSLWADRQRRPAFWLLVLGFLLLATVPFQEYAEHHLTTRKFSDLYGRYLEEATEVLGGCAILAAAVYLRRGRLRGGLEAVMPDPLRMPSSLRLLGLGFLAHLATLCIPLVEIGRWDGSPSAYYPYAVYLLLACYAYWAPSYRGGGELRIPEIRGFWAAVGVLFLACSVGTIQNLWGLFGGFVEGLRREIFDQPVPLYVLLVLAVWFFAVALRAARGWRLGLLTLLPLTFVVFFHVPPIFQIHLAAGFFALVCSLALMRPVEPVLVPVQTDRAPAGSGPGPSGRAAA